jgi:integrase
VPRFQIQYLAERKAANLSNRTINMEVACLARILKRAKPWHLISDEIKPLPVRQRVSGQYHGVQKAKLLKIALSKPDWQVAQLAMTLALNTTMRACEIRGLRWQDINPIERVITVKKSKTDAGLRQIPPNNDAWAAIHQLRDRAKTIFNCAPLPTWFVFPRAEGGNNPDPTEPMNSWRTAWSRLTRVVHCPMCG